MLDAARGASKVGCQTRQAQLIGVLQELEAGHQLYGHASSRADFTLHLIDGDDGARWICLLESEQLDYSME